MTKQEVTEIHDALFKMQELDVHIAELEISKVYQPKLLSELRENVEILDKKLVEETDKLKNLKIHQSSTELETEEIKQRLEHSKEKLMQVSSNKEYEAVQDEIVENEEMLALKEEETLKIYDEEELTQSEKSRLEKEYADTKTDSEEKIASIAEELSHVEENIKKFEDERNSYSKSLPKKILYTYNRIRKGLGNLAIVHVQQRGCGGCFQQLTSQKIQDLIRGDAIVFCPSCGRILSWHEEDSPEASK